MADKRISQLVERVNIANNDVLPIVASGATTTNKVTVSTLQDWMQSNLDVGVTSVGLSMPSAFVVSNSPVTASGNISVTGAGTVSQYIRGDGSLADFPSGGGGGGASVNYYLNGSVSQGTIGGIAYKEMNRVPVLGAGTDFVAIADGYLASFITDAGDPALLEIPAGNWNFETYFSASSGGGTPTFYVELYKVDSGGTATLIASNSATPELIAFGTTITPYFSTLAVPTTSLAITDRLALRYYVARSGRTITLHTENSHLCQIITTFTTGLTALNGLTAQVQNLATGTSGTDFNISSATNIHTFNLPTASATNRGALSSADWTTFNNKQEAGNYTTTDTDQTITGVKTFSQDIFVNSRRIGRGSGDIVSNTVVGNSALRDNTTGSENSAFGGGALRQITTGSANTAIGFFSMLNSETGAGNVAIGNGTLQGNNGSNNVAVGNSAGAYITGGTTLNTTCLNSVYIGTFTRPSANGNTNEIVIGQNALGNGSNTVTIGNSSTTNNYFTGNVRGGAFIKSGGTSTQFLKADGSVDSSTYLTTGTASSTYVPYTGAAANVDLGVYNLTSSAVNVNGSGSNAGVINLESNAIFPLVNGYGTIGSGTTNQFNFYQTTGAGVFRGAIFSLNSITASATRTYTLPDADGTLAFTSQIPTNPVGGTGAQGRVAYWDSTGTITSDSLFQWNDTFKRLGIGRTPTVSLDVEGAGFFSGALGVGGALNGTSASFTSTLGVTGNTALGGTHTPIYPLHVQKSISNNYISFIANTNTTTGTSFGLFMNAGTNGSDRAIQVNNAANSLELFRVFGNGNTDIFGTLGVTGAATFSSSVNLGTNANSADTASLNIKQAGTSYNNGIYIERGGERNGYHMYIGGALDSLTFRRNYFGTQSDVMSLTRDGNVGIGTASPASRLHVVNSSGGTTASNYLQIEGSIADNSNYPGISLKGGTLATTYPNISLTNGGLALILNSGIATAYNNPAQISLNNGVISFSTGNNAAATERMQITSGGNVIIQSTAVAGLFSGENSNSGAATLQSWNKATSGDNKFVEFYTEGGGGTLRGSIDYNRAAGLVRYNVTSDKNLKNIIGDSDKNKSIEILNSTRIREYSWKDDESNKSQIGVIAQELHETFKGAVSVGSDIELLGTEEYKPWGVDKTAFTFHLVAGFQEHQRIIKELQAQIDSLKNQIK